MSDSEDADYIFMIENVMKETTTERDALKKEIEQLKWANKVNSDEWKQLTEHLKSRCGRLEEALGPQGIVAILNLSIKALPLWPTIDL